MDQLIQTIEAVWSPDLEGIGIGVPGIVDSKNGVVYDIQNIPSWVEVPVGNLLQAKFKVPVFVRRR
jgi:glucokinase